MQKLFYDQSICIFLNTDFLPHKQGYWQELLFYRPTNMYHEYDYRYMHQTTYKALTHQDNTLSFIVKMLKYRLYMAQIEYVRRIYTCIYKKLLEFYENGHNYTQ